MAIDITGGEKHPMLGSWRVGRACASIPARTRPARDGAAVARAMMSAAASKPKSSLATTDNDLDVLVTVLARDRPHLIDMVEGRRTRRGEPGGKAQRRGAVVSGPRQVSPVRGECASEYDPGC